MQKRRQITTAWKDKFLFISREFWRRRQDSNYIAVLAIRGAAPNSQNKLLKILTPLHLPDTVTIYFLNKVLHAKLITS